jgi:hypothetical protein
MAELRPAPKGGGGQSNRSQAQTRVCGSDDRWRGVHSPTKKGGAPFSATACVKQASTTRPWRRGRQERNIVARSGARKRAKGPASPSGLGRVRAGVHAYVRATCLHRRARERERAGVGPHRRPGRWWHTTARRARKGRQMARARW